MPSVVLQTLDIFEQIKEFTDTFDPYFRIAEEYGYQAPSYYEQFVELVTKMAAIKNPTVSFELVQNELERMAKADLEAFRQRFQNAMDKNQKAREAWEQELKRNQRRRARTHFQSKLNEAIRLRNDLADALHQKETYSQDLQAYLEKLKHFKNHRMPELQDVIRRIDQEEQAFLAYLERTQHMLDDYDQRFAAHDHDGTIKREIDNLRRVRARKSQEMEELRKSRDGYKAEIDLYFRELRDIEPELKKAEQERRTLDQQWHAAESAVKELERKVAELS